MTRTTSDLRLRVTTETAIAVAALALPAAWLAGPSGALGIVAAGALTAGNFWWLSRAAARASDPQARRRHPLRRAVRRVRRAVRRWLRAPGRGGRRPQRAALRADRPGPPLRQGQRMNPKELVRTG